MKKFLYIGTIVILLLIINGLGRSIWDLWHKQDLLKQAQAQLISEKQENSGLKGKLTYVQTNSFVETQARDKLFMVKPGESEVVISQDLLNKPQAQQSASAPVWQQWLNLFVNNG